MNEYRTHDLYVAAFMSASGVPLDRIDKATTGHATFVFLDGPRCAELQRAWLARTGTIEPSIFAMMIKQLKSAVHSA